MGRPSEPLLRWLRHLIRDRKLNSAAVAETAGIARNRAKKLLSGAEPMTVDELLQLTKALDLTPADFGMSSVPELPDDDTSEADPSELEDKPVDDDEPSGVVAGLDPYGNHPRQLFQVGFTLGCDFFFLARVSELESSGVPKEVLTKYAGRDLPIKLDAAYHQYNNPRYEDGGILLTLSFDQLYDCRFPWAAIRQVVFFPVIPDAPVEDEPEEETPTTPKGRPHLRLVE